MTRTKNQGLRAGVMGAGAFGTNHVRKYAALEGVTLAAVLDADAARAGALTAQYGGVACTDLDDFLQRVDVVSVATPADSHAALAVAALRAGKPVYVEKPLAATLADADLMLDAAGTLCVACGHQERAVFAAMGLMDIPDKPIALRATRAGPWTGRGADVSVTLDLMVHDLDLCQSLGLGGVQAITARGSAQHGAHMDEITAHFRFASGTEVELTASRVADARARTMQIVYGQGSIEIDFVQRTFRNTTPYAVAADFAQTPAGLDPLGVSMQAFIDAVRNICPRPLVTGTEARAALALALRADQAALTQPIHQGAHDHAHADH